MVCSVTGTEWPDDRLRRALAYTDWSSDSDRMVKTFKRAYDASPPQDPSPALEPIDVCNALAQWAEVAEVQNRESKGRASVSKSDLLGRLIYGGENGPSKTPCPVHKGVWSGCHGFWPSAIVTSARDGRVVERVIQPEEVDAQLQEWWDAGCRCATHKGSSCTTGWNPDAACGCAP
jgi:hypothetical protein